MTKRLHGRVAIVTGAASGIGRGIATRFVAEGANVVAVDRDHDALADLSGVTPLVVDMLADDAPATVLAFCEKQFGALDILVNNVGLGNAPPLHETNDDLFDHYIGVNLRTTFRLSRDALPMLRAQRGSIVNMASSIALSGYRRWAAYSAAKAGVVGLTRQMAADYGAEGIRVNAVAPGVIATPQTAARLDTPEFRATILGTMPLGHAGTPEDVAAAVAFLASDDARMITGQILAIDGGQTATTYVRQEMIDSYVAAQKSDLAGDTAISGEQP